MALLGEDKQSGDTTKEKTDEGQPGTSRLETFSDGVIAIILTIMVLELHIDPHALEKGVWTGFLAPLLPKLASYTLSYLMIALYWLNHHQLLPTAPKSTPALIWWNNNFLFWLSLVPLATSFWGQNVLEPVAVAFYGVTLFAASVSFALLRQRVAKCRPEDDDAVVGHHKKHLRRSAFSAALYAAAILLTPFFVYGSIALFLVVPVLFLLPERLPKGAVIED